jgi:lipooligosaccharide transport system ATP-binding protein
VDGIDFDIQEAECVGFLGPNGAGKSSTMGMLYGRVGVTAGTLRVAGLDVSRQGAAVRRLTGVVAQDDTTDHDLDVEGNLLSYARYFGLRGRPARERTEELLEFFQLADRRHARIDDLSGGLKRRVTIARGLVNAPRLLLLDEPTTGLDPQARQAVWQRLRALRRGGVTMVLTTHYMEEASELCDRIILMGSGKILLEGRPAALVRERAGEQVVEVHEPDAARRADLLARIDGLAEAEESIDALYLYGPNARALLDRVLGSAPGVRARLRPANLEDVYLRLTGRDLAA